MGPSADRPPADTLPDVFIAFLVVWSLTAVLWAVLERRVSLQDDQIVIVRGTGRKVVLSRGDVKSVHCFPVRNWYLLWVSYKRGAPLP